MTKEEMKNRISMALKDPILQQGFECICKNLAELEKAYNEAEELLDKQIEATYKLFEENKELKELVEKYRQAVDKCLHITFMGGGCEVNTIGQYATLVDGYLTDVEGLAKWKN